MITYTIKEGLAVHMHTGMRTGQHKHIALTSTMPSDKQDVACNTAWTKSKEREDTKQAVPYSTRSTHSQF